MSGPPSEDVLCTCAEITRTGFVTAMAQNPGLDFEALMVKTGAGMRCTACRLDLELAYTESFGRLVVSPGSKSGELREKRKSLKALFYEIIDRLAPMTPLRLSNTVPVLLRKGVRQFVVVCNDSPLYGGKVRPEPATVRVIVRDNKGKVRADETRQVTDDCPLDMDVTSFLPEPGEGELGVGSVEIMRSWNRPALRGTTRPQIVIEAPGGCGAVHTTAPNGPGATWYTALSRRDEDRILLGLINPTDREMQAAFSYPYAKNKTATERCRISVPPHGAYLHEVALDDGEAEALPGGAFSVCCSADRAHKVYLFTASPALDRFSVDHPASG